jgi:cell division protein FtsL
MTGEAFEYAIKKDVRNNPIVREIDRERHREMWRSAGVGLFLVLVLVVFVWRHTDLVYQDVRSHNVEDDIADMNKENERLRIQIEKMRATARIDAMARQDLHMIQPDPGDRIVLERAIKSPQPAGSVLARR